MKLVCTVLLCVFFLPLLAEEVDDAVITVPTGWTAEKESYQHEWQNKTPLERQSSITTLEQRMNNIFPRLPEDVYDIEEGKYVGYRIRLQQTYERLIAAPDAANYAEMAYLLDQAEAFVSYVERQNTLPRNEPDMPSGVGQLNIHRSFHDELQRQGVGWADGYVDGSFTDHWTPRVATYEDMVWVGATNDAGFDTFEIWHSTDAGQYWTLWHNSGVSGDNDRWLFDLSVDPESTILYSTYYYNNNDPWIRRWTNFADSNQFTIHQIEGTTDNCAQPVLSVEHLYSYHRLCCMYYNSTTDQIVIAQSTDFGYTWNVVHTTSWTTTSWPRPKGASGAASQTTDCFYFVVQKSANTLTVFESVSGGVGTWIETDYVHSQDIVDVDIAASHNYNTMSTVVSFGYAWNANDYNVRVLFRPNLGGAFISQLVDGDGAMTRTPVISCDAEYVYGNNAGPDYYHLAYYKHRSATDSLYYPFALRCLNDSSALDNFDKNSAIYHEAVGAITIDTLASQYQFGRPAAFYQIDITTNWNTMNSQYFPHIVWLRYYPNWGDADPRTNFPDQDVGVAANAVTYVMPITISLTPNPLRNSGLLTYVLKDRAMVNVTLYDAAGRLERTLVNETQSAGKHTLAINDIGLAAGVYFLRVVGGNETGSGTMIVVR